ncbi:NUMOD4 motif-containing HNH endonuclease [Advenella mimigardefordensis]|uniref:Putative endonuklease-like protein n=1 Tax=Advenella mimigardefordensis (strain DSM 17166 / LMG 22922 / DPN7) TaxID=1247726 RepID=W0P8Z4_ADVMD|nr:NUMOD4 motif-containing HNH endonuclease [Advenella mimigardefordensis]AHG63176.1 putative endonuklease-like protein [Advenella mimigardefordensis DPN7]
MKFSQIADESKEVWEDIPGYEGIYQVSNMGKVLSLGRYAYAEYKGTPYRQFRPARLMKTHSGNGYLYVSLEKGGVKVRKGVHQLVLMAFVGLCPEGMEVCHNDGVRANNNLTNLRYGSRQDNADDRIKHGNSRPGSECHLSKLTENDVRKILSCENWDQARALAKVLRVTRDNVRAIWLRQTWKHI